MSEEVLITVDEDGNVEVVVNGVIGSSCEMITKDLEKALGEVKTRTKKPEYDQKIKTQKQIITR